MSTAASSIVDVSSASRLWKRSRSSVLMSESRFTMFATTKNDSYSALAATKRCTILKMWSAYRRRVSPPSSRPPSSRPPTAKRHALFAAKHSSKSAAVVEIMSQSATAHTNAPIVSASI